MARVTSLAGYPIEQHNSPNIGGSMTGHKGIVLHIAQGTYRGTISWQNNPDQRYASGEQVTTSSTWIVGRETGEWAQMVDTARVAWCQRSGSYDWLSVELAGFAPNPPTAWQVEACAQLLAWAHRTHGIPLTVADHPGQRGLGHHSMDREGIDPEWGHDSCPGSGVIAAKAAIVARATQIIGGDDVSDAYDVLWTGGTDMGPKVPGAISAPYKTYGNGVVDRVFYLQKLVEELAAKPPVQSAPVDPAVVKAVLLDPQVLAAIAKAVNDDSARRQVD